MSKETIRRAYLLGVLATILAFNGANNLTFGIALQGIKGEFSLSDTQLGLLTGIAFALFYTLTGVPISRWADRGDRVALVAITTILWCGAVILCALAQNFAQLLLIRVCVAVGEAGCFPAGLSLIADYFSRAERPRAVAVYLQGGSVGIVLGYFLGGWSNQLYAWRWTFVLLGLPGLALAALAWLTLQEPRRLGKTTLEIGTAGESRVAAERPDSPVSAPPGLGEICATLWNSRTFRQLTFFYTVSSFFSGAIAQWQPSFLVRTYALGTGELGTWMAVIYGSGLMAGTYLSGEWATRRAANNERLQFRAVAVAFSCLGVFAALAYLAANRYWAFGWLELWSVAAAMTSAPLFATIQTLAPARMRATAFTFIQLFANLIGLGLGPLMVGALSDALRPWVGAESLRDALLLMCPGYLWGGWHLWRASKTVMRDLEAAQTDNECRRDHRGLARIHDRAGSCPTEPCFDARGNKSVCGQQRL